jgi:FtsH-binding integral membrane protein
MIWIGIMVFFWLVSTLSNKFAFSPSRNMQYAGLALYICLEAFIFLPLIYIATMMSGESILLQAAGMTLFLFAGLTAVAFFTKTDFSFLRTAIIIGGFVALGVIVVGMMMGFSLGLFFSGAMILLASASILYQTSQIKLHHTTDQYVGAELQLFASIMLLFWYLVNFLLNRD